MLRTTSNLNTDTSGETFQRDTGSLDVEIKGEGRVDDVPTNCFFRKIKKKFENGREIVLIITG